MTYLQSRVATLLALPPLTVAVFCICDPISAILRTRWPGAEPMQIAALASTLVFGGLWWAIWRPFLHRDGRRLTATLALAALLIGQVLVWHPMWHSPGCAQDDVLRCAQSLTDLGLWCLGFAMTWWGGRRWREIRRQSAASGWTHAKGRQDMSPGTVRLAVGFGLLPLLPGVFFIAGNALHQFFSLQDTATFVASYGICAVLTVVVWWLIWRSVVCWTPQRMTRTGVLVAMMMVAPFSPLIPHGHVDWIETLVLLMPLLALAAWFAGTAYAWRLAPGEMPMTERGANPMLVAGGIGPDAPMSVPCGNCDYDLRGLREARCPECGWTTTLDALVRRAVAMCAAAID